MAKKEKHNKNHGAHEAWEQRKHDINSSPVAVQLQKIWRIGALRQRAAEDRLTDKNRVEMKRLGV